MAPAALPSELVPARIVRVSHETPKVLGLLLQAPPDYSWAPGQHLALRAANEDGPLGYYSIASAPRVSEPGILELAVAMDSLPAGVSAEEGRDVWISPPAGELTVGRFKRAESLVLIGMGTGVAPLRAILQELAEESGNRGPQRELLKGVALLQGARQENELLFRDEFHLYGLQGMDYRPVLSRPSKEWTLRTGRVQNHLDGLDLRARFRVCGSRAMVNEVTERLLEGGVLLTQIDGEGY